LAAEGKTPYLAFEVGSNALLRLPEIIESPQLLHQFQVQYPGRNPHQSVPFTETAQEIVATNLAHETALDIMRTAAKK